MSRYFRTSCCETCHTTCTSTPSAFATATVILSYGPTLTRTVAATDTLNGTVTTANYETATATTAANKLLLLPLVLLLYGF